MTNPTLPHKQHQPSAWAVCLFVGSSAFALVALALFWMEYQPF